MVQTASTTVSPELPPVASDVDRQFHAYGGHYPQNPYTNDMFMDNFYYPHYNM